MRTHCYLNRFLTAILFGAVLLPTGSRGWASEPQWIRVSSSHFSVLTDAGEKKGREVVLRFEQMRSLFGQLLMRPRLNMSEPLQIIAFKSDDEYARVAPILPGQPGPAPGFFLAGDDRNYIVLNAAGDDGWRAVSHEFAHWMLNYNYPPTQAWFDEGFAEYFSSIRLDNKQVELGADPEPQPLTDILNQSGWLAIPDLFSMRPGNPVFQEGTHHTMFYAESWMVMHYLLNRNLLSETGTYFELVENQNLPVAQAIQQAYGTTPAQFEQAVKDYFHSLAPSSHAQDAAEANAGGAKQRLPAAVGPDGIGASVQVLVDSVTKALLAEMTLRLPPHREQAIKDLQSLTSDPKTDSATTHRSLAWALLEKKDYDSATEELSKGMEADSSDPWVHYYLALVKYHKAQASGQQFQGLSNMMQDLKVVLDIYPDFAEAYAMLAMARVEGGGVNSAMEAMRLAMQLSPRNESYSLGMAQIYLAGKKWDAAAALLERLRSSQNPQVAQAARKNLEDLPMLKKYGILPQTGPDHNSSTEPSVSATHVPAEPPRQMKPEDESGDEGNAPAEPAPDRRKSQFVKGRLLNVDCRQAPAALLTISTGKKTMKLRTENYKTLLLIGSDEFSCEWKDRPVAVNYKAGGKADGDLVSLEMQ